MKAIQIMMDEELLKELDQDSEVRRVGRSAVVRKITSEYIERRKRNQIANQYKRAYESNKDAVEEEFHEWADEGIWPDE